jgi:hypothetical protein
MSEILNTLGRKKWFTEELKAPSEISLSKMNRQGNPTIID